MPKFTTSIESESCIATNVIVLTAFLYKTKSFYVFICLFGWINRTEIEATFEMSNAGFQKPHLQPGSAFSPMTLVLTQWDRK